VSTARVQTWTVCSVQVWTAQAGSTQRHTRLSQARHHRAAADRQVPHPDRAASMQPGLAAAGRTAHGGGGGLDGQPPVVVDDLGGGDFESLQAEQDRP
jgi:hypothetical protein